MTKWALAHAHTTLNHIQSWMHTLFLFSSLQQQKIFIVYIPTHYIGKLIFIIDSAHLKRQKTLLKKVLNITENMNIIVLLYTYI